jgi:hypothetical protein
MCIYCPNKNNACGKSALEDNLSHLYLTGIFFFDPESPFELQGRHPSVAVYCAPIPFRSSRPALMFWVSVLARSYVLATLRLYVYFATTEGKRRRSYAVQLIAFRTGLHFKKKGGAVAALRLKLTANLDYWVILTFRTCVCLFTSSQ